MGTSITPDEIKRFEITEVYAHPEAKVDIVLVHGLNGHPRMTWTAKNGVFWPTDLLPLTLKKAKARVLVYGYNADVYAFGSDKGASSDMIHQHAQTLVNSLALERKSEEMDENAIIWVAHSLGGILVKRALEYSNGLTSKSSDPSRSIFVSTYGIIFLGTPHTGSDHAKMGTILQSICNTVIPKSILHTEPHLVRTLLSDNETLQNINVHFLDIFQRFQIDFVHEAAKTELVKGMKDFVVDQASASMQLPGVRYYGIEANHSNMCKFESKNAPGYLNVSMTIKTWVSEAPPIIESRLVLERDARRQAKVNEANETLGIYAANPMSQSSSSVGGLPDLPNSGINSTSMIHSVASIEPEPETPYFIKPHGFRPNSIFVGRKEELAQMHQMLFDKKRREEGTSAVLLQSLPGGGKTHLARQYVFDHIKDFPGGIFWIRAKSQEQLAAGFWEIARQVALKPSTCVDASSLDPSQFVLIVKDWFGANQEWLLVLDGIHFDHTDELLRYIPDSKNSSLIFTSTEWSVVGDHHFMNPQVIKLPLLSAREAQDLFLLELNRTNPSSDELNQAMELVQRMEFLPVVIHAGVQRLNATGEPLARFARHYATGPKLRGLETFNDVVGELESADAVEALNLMRIICFFSGHVPVEMIVLGLNALETIDIHIKTYEVSSGRSLNNTFKILNRFALVERSEHNVSMRSSQSSGTSRETLIDGVDIIRLHSVVQDFFVDSLKADGHLSLWLDRAVSVFCTSYDMANRRIQRKSNSGLVVGDYRVYEIHGTRLMQHITRNEKKIAELGKTREVLDSCLKEVKQQIDTRTRTSSEDLVLGRRETFQTSIFNRSGSSSDTGPETPGSFDRESSGRLTWDTETKVQHESPVSIHEERMQYDDGLYRVPYLPYPVTEDQGYDGDRDEVMTERPLQRSTSPDLSAETQRTLARRRHPRDRSSHVDLHRTIRAMERNRYRDSAGAWRQVNARVPDPRVSHETANPKDWSRTTSNGPVPGKSSAQAVLSHISKNSPPPLNFRGFRDHRPPSTLSSPRSETGGYLSSSNVPPAVDDALPQELPLLSTRGRSTSRASLTPLEIPAISVPTPTPYPVENRLPIVSDSLGMQTSPSLVYGQPYPIAGMAVYGPPRVFVPENLPVVTPSQQYPRQVGPLPIEYVASTSYPIWNPVNSPITTTQQGTIINHIDPAPQALFPDENRLDSNYIYHSGYTSQPLSRNGSNQSAGTVAAGVKNRRPSLAESEPMPQLPNFSPRIAPTSYQMYEDLALVPRSELDELRSGSNQGGRGRSRFRWAGWRTPRLGFGHAALIERVDQWVPQNEYAGSENLRPGTSHSSSDTGPAPSVSRTRSQPSLGTRPARLSQSPLSGISNIMLSDNEAPAMSRSTSGSASGGVRVGNRVVAFGDKVTPSAVDRLRSELTSSEAVDGLGPPYDVVSGIGRRARGLSSPERPR